MQCTQLSSVSLQSSPKRYTTSCWFLLTAMLLVALFGCLATVTVAATGNNANSGSEITEYRNEQDGRGGYFFSYRTSDGTYREEKGELKNPGTDQEHLEVQGLSIWTAPDGQEYKLSFVANRNGYVAQGDHLPRTLTIERPLTTERPSTPPFEQSGPEIELNVNDEEAHTPHSPENELYVDDEETPQSPGIELNNDNEESYTPPTTQTTFSPSYVTQRPSITDPPSGSSLMKVMNLLLAYSLLQG